jgi:hypothetical protein
MLIHFASFSLNYSQNFYRYKNFQSHIVCCYQLVIVYFFLVEKNFLLQIFHFLMEFDFKKFGFLMDIMFQIHFDCASIDHCLFDLHSKNQGYLKTLINHFFLNLR